MKKSLLIGAALIIGASGFAQNRLANNPKIKKAVANNSANHKFDAENAPSVSGKPVAGKMHQSTNAACGTTKVSSSYNVLSVGGGVSTFNQNVLSYNKDLNINVITHRGTKNWGTGSPNSNGLTSGAIEANWVDVTTGIWDSMIVYKDSTKAHGGRYPGGTVFNPAGNTTLANAFMAASGPDVGSAFEGTFYATRPIDANRHSTNAPYIFNDDTFALIGAAPFGQTSSGFLNGDMQQVGSSVWVTGTLIDPAVTSANGTGGKGAIIGKGNFSGGTFTWTRDTIVPGFYLNPDLTGGTGYMSAGEPRLAFSPDGQTGYIVLFGRDATDYCNSADSMMSPFIYKSTNGGTSWSRVLQGYDWSNQHPEVQKNVADLLVPENHFTFAYSPYGNQHGIDLAVDANGTLHLVSTVAGPGNNGAFKDSLTFSHYVGYWDYVNTHPVIWDFMTDGTSWKTMMVDSIITSFVGDDPSSDTTASHGAWANGGTFLGYGAHLTVSRSTDGSKIFYGWSDTDPTATGTVFNSQPDMMVKGYDVSTGKVTTTTNITSGLGAVFYPYVSDVSYLDNAQNKWVVPFVFVQSGIAPISAGLYDGLSQADYYYSNCAAFAQTDFTIPAVVNTQKGGGTCTDPWSIKTNTGFNGTVKNYPNPFSGSTNIVVTLPSSKTIAVSVFDAIGNVVFTKTVNGNTGDNTIVFDGSNLNAGVYYYTVTSGYEKVTKKLVIQK